MKTLSSAELKIDDFDDELQFTVSRETGWIEVVLASGAVAAFGVYGFIQQSVLLLFGCAVGIGALLINWALGPTTMFRISAQSVVATGNLQRWSASDVRIPAEEVKSIGWSSGGENRSGGIYVWHGPSGLKSTCVLPGISHKKAQSITDAIKARFPQFVIRGGSVVALSFGSGN
jgi:hypothetical protein